MARLLHPLFSLLACATKQELSRQVQLLKTENEILRSKLPKRITMTPQERRRLVKAGRSLSASSITLTPIWSAPFVSSCCLIQPREQRLHDSAVELSGRNPLN